MNEQPTRAATRSPRTRRTLFLAAACAAGAIGVLSTAAADEAAPTPSTRPAEQQPVETNNAPKQADRATDLGRQLTGFLRQTPARAATTRPAVSARIDLPNSEVAALPTPPKQNAVEPAQAVEPVKLVTEVVETEQQMVPPTELTDGRLAVVANDSRVICLNRPVARVSVPSPEIADVTLLEPDVLLVHTRSPGLTEITLWDDQRRMETIQVQATMDLREVQEKLDMLLPVAGIEAVDLKGRIALRGRVSDITVAEQAEAIASSYGDVVSFLEITGVQQVMLEIRFAEVSKTAAKQLGLNVGIVGENGSGASNLGQVNQFNPGRTGDGNLDVTQLATGATASPAVTLFGGGIVGDVAFEAFLSALRENNLLRVLAEPNLTILSGQSGEFLAGGRIPVPVPQDNGAIGITYEPYGIRLRALPVVLGDGRIRVRVEPEVSDLDHANGVTIGGASVPGFTVRRLETEVELVDGQTFVLAGLLNSSVAANKQVTPLLGDIPILGALFRSTRYQRAETELVVLITPRLVSPMDPGEVPPLPGEGWKHPNEIELFLLGQLGGEAGVGNPGTGDVGGAADAATGGKPKLEASYAYLPVEPAAN